MALLKTALLIQQTTEVAYRADIVRRDPAVVKAAKVAGADLAQAGRSALEFLSEVGAAWARSGLPETPQAGVVAT